MPYDEGLLQRCLDTLEQMRAGPIRNKNVFGMRGLMREGKMFAAVGEESIIVRMPPTELEAALERPGVVPFTPTGQSLGTWVEIREDAVADDPDLAEWLEAGLRSLR